MTPPILKDGQYLDAAGNVRDADGTIAVKAKKPPAGQHVDAAGNIRDKAGQIVTPETPAGDEAPTVQLLPGQTLGEDGNIHDDTGNVFSPDGTLISVHGVSLKLTTDQRVRRLEKAVCALSNMTAGRLTGQVDGALLELVEEGHARNKMADARQKADYSS